MMNTPAEQRQSLVGKAAATHTHTGHRELSRDGGGSEDGSSSSSAHRIVYLR